MGRVAGSQSCICGREFKNRRAALPHWRACPAERKRSAEFIARIESGEFRVAR